MHPAQQVASRGRLAGRVYDGLPRALQTAAVSLKGWAIRRERYGGSFAALLADYASRTLASDDEVLAARRAKLRRILVHARAHIPYWSQRLRTFDIDPERVQGPEDLRSLPILTKDEVLRLGAGLHWPEAPRGATRLAHTDHRGRADLPGHPRGGARPVGRLVAVQATAGALARNVARDAHGLDDRSREQV